MSNEFDSVYLDQELSVIKSQIDNVTQTKNLATIKDILNYIHFSDIKSPYQITENIGNAYVKKFLEAEIYEDVPISYIIEPKQTGAFYGMLYTKKDKNENETQHYKESFFNNYARFIIDLVSQKVIYSNQLGQFVYVNNHSYTVLDEDTWLDYYPTPRNAKLYIDDFLSVMLEVYSLYIKERHDCKLLPYLIGGKDWIFDCKSLELSNKAPGQNELLFNYFDCEIEEINVAMANQIIDSIANDKESNNNLKLIHAYILLRKMNLIPAEKWFLMKDFGRTGKGLVILSFHSIFKVNPVNMDALINNIGASTENAWLSFKGVDIAHANESGAIDDKSMRVLRKIATGEIITGRSLGHNATTFKNESVLVLDTNESVDIGQITANVSRTVKIAFKDRPPGETEQQRHAFFKPYWEFIRPGGELSQTASLAFLLNSLNYLKEIGGAFKFADATIKNYASAEDFTETQRIMLLTIERLGFILAKDEILTQAIQEDYGSLRYKEAKNDMKKVGVSINKQKWLDGKNFRVHKIGDKKLFKLSVSMLERLEHDDTS